MVGDALLLLVGGVVLLVDDDEAELRERQEERRARADHRADLAMGDGPPDALARFRPELRMPFRGPRAEAGGETIEKRPRQRDLRKQDERLAFLPQRLRHRLEIDLGLAGPGDPVEERDGEAV